MTGKAAAHPAFAIGVSLYCFNDEYIQARWSLEDMMELAVPLGRRVEIVGPIHQRGFPYLTPEFERRFRSSIERFDLIPTCYGSYADPFMLPDRDLTADELEDYTRIQLRTAAALGFPVIRLQHFAYPIAERLLPLAEKLDVTMAYELHAPMTFESDVTRRLLDQIVRVDSRHLGIIPDCGIFARSVPAFRVELARSAGIAEPLIADALRYWSEGMDILEAQERLVAAGLPAGHFPTLETFFGTVGKSDPAAMIEFMPFVHHVHGKFFSIVDGDEPDVRYAEVVKALIAGEFRGCISSEYEGARDVETFSLVCAHQTMIRRHALDAVAHVEAGGG